MMSGLHIRPMTQADVAAVMALASELKQAPHWPETAYTSALDPAASPLRIALVATLEERIVGFVLGSVVPPEAELESIAVDSRYQRQGLAKQLLSALLLELRAAAASLILLEVRASNQPARAFYRAFGFEECGFRTRYYSAPTEDAVLFRHTIA